MMDVEVVTIVFFDTLMLWELVTVGHCFTDYLTPNYKGQGAWGKSPQL